MVQQLLLTLVPAVSFNSFFSQVALVVVVVPAWLSSNCWAYHNHIYTVHTH